MVAGACVDYFCSSGTPGKGTGGGGVGLTPTPRREGGGPGGPHTYLSFPRGTVGAADPYPKEGRGWSGTPHTNLPFPRGTVGVTERPHQGKVPHPRLAKRPAPGVSGHEEVPGDNNNTLLS